MGRFGRQHPWLQRLVRLVSPAPRARRHACRERWSHYPTSPPDRTGAGKLFAMARDAWPGWQRPSQSRRQAKDTPAIVIRVVNPTELEFAPVPPRIWVVQDWLPIGTVTGNYGDGGTGKTLLSQLLQTSCATCIPWAGQRVLRCKSFGLYCEDSEEELHRRQDDINTVFDQAYSGLGDMRWISGVGDDWTLVNFTADGRMHTTERWNLLVREVTAFGARLLCLDTAADLFGGNENDRSQVRRFISLLGGLAREIDGSVLLNCHPSRSGLASGNLDGGSTAWSNTVPLPAGRSHDPMARTRQPTHPTDCSSDEKPTTPTLVIQSGCAGQRAFSCRSARTGIASPASSTVLPPKPCSLRCSTALRSLSSASPIARTPATMPPGFLLGGPTARAIRPRSLKRPWPGCSPETRSSCSPTDGRATYTSVLFGHHRSTKIDPAAATASVHMVAFRNERVGRCVGAAAVPVSD